MRPDTGWQRRFDDPIPLPRGRQLVTLEDAGNYITKLPRAVHEDTRRQVGDRDHLNLFANSDLADEWFVVNDPEGVVFEYEVIGVVDDETGSGRQRHR